VSVIGAERHRQMKQMVKWLLIFLDQQDKLCLKAFTCFVECKFCKGRGCSINN
jgi:hypothetical protein